MTLQEDGAHGTNEQAGAPAPPPQQTYRPPPPPRSTSGLNNYSDAFGDVRRINPEQPGSNTAGGCAPTLLLFHVYLPKGKVNFLVDDLLVLSLCLVSLDSLRWKDGGV